MLGDHSDTMVPMTRYASVGGIPLADILSKEKLTRSLKEPQTAAPGVNLLKRKRIFRAGRLLLLAWAI